METLITLHAAVVIAATVVAIAVFLGLAIYVATQNLYGPAAWLFSLSCLIIAGAYFISFFTVSGSESSLLFFLRLRWVAIIFGPVLFLRLAFFYFPPTWQRYRSWILLPAYLLSLGLAWTTLFTNWIIVAPLLSSIPHPAMPMPGPLMPFLIAFLILEVLGIMPGLLRTYQLSYSPSFRRQIGFLLLPTGLVFIASTIHSFNIFIDDSTHLPHEIPDALLIGAACLYLKAVIHYGSFVGRPLARKDLFYAGLTATTGLGALYLTSALDQRLMNQTRFPYPPVTAILVVALAVSFPTVSRWVTRRLDKWFFRSERQQQASIDQLAGVLATALDLEQLQDDLLDTLFMLLDTRSGFIASAGPNSPPTSLTVQVVRGSLDLQPGTPIHRPPLDDSSEAQLIIPSISALQSEPAWQEMALFCPLAIGGIDGVLALGEKRDDLPFTAQDLSLCTVLIKQLGTLKQTAPLRQQRNDYSEAPRNQHQALQQLGQETTPSPHHNLALPENIVVPVEIRILGSLQVIRNGQIVTESAWGSEKAKLLLAYLLWKSPTGATREELSEMLWPDRPPDETANVFHVTLHRLRRVLHPKTKGKDEANYILHDRGRYRFNVAASHWLDVAQFEELIHSPDLADQQVAIELYRGAYLEDIAWGLPCDIEVEQRRLEHLYADGLRRLVPQSDERQMTLYLEKLLTVEPADETARRALILSYLAQGRDDLVRRHIEHWQRILAELGLEPLPETAAFWKTIQAKTVYGLNGFTN